MDFKKGSEFQNQLMDSKNIYKFQNAHKFQKN